MTGLLTRPALDITHGPTAPRAFADRLTEAGGRLVITFPDPAAHQRNLSCALGLLSALGPVLGVYPADGCWSALRVRTDADPNRTHGTGENRLHADLVDRELIPRHIALYCEREDPFGGGASALADLWAAVGELTRAERELLARPVFSYFTDDGVHGVGDPVERFPVLSSAADPAAGPVRFTAKALPHLERGELLHTGPGDAAPTVAAYRRLAQAALAHRTTVRLAPGQLLVFDQWRHAHGRMPLGPGQHRLPEDGRRLLWQTYTGAPAGGAR
ncbi:TauD/TfdA family dioxygenase [Streptomyces sp. NPDC057638]|uniref:TauD/TfdA family dioxygenase n=1 Tax=Streptomyces sp. NPDC057638 TaxID=3346190 RepID=UPI00367E7E54